MRLTTDSPKNNVEMALNLFFVKDKEVWVRGYGRTTQTSACSTCRGI
ncbi:MAG: hypothetical protein ACLR8L_00155 [Oscillospiraceae bacterium]